MASPSSTAVKVDTTMSEITLTNTLTSPLLRLPAELRNRIYTYIGHSEQIPIAASIIKPKDTRNPSKFTMQFHLPALLSTYQQTRSEATALVYAQTTVDTLSGDAWYWLYSKSPHRLCAYVTSLHISEWFAELIEQETEECEMYSKDAKCCTLDLPRLERVRVICRAWAVDVLDGSSMREAIGEWLGKKSLDIIFEAGLDLACRPPSSLEGTRRMWEDYERDDIEE